MITNRPTDEKKEKKRQSNSQLFLDGNHLTTSDIFLAVFDFNLKVSVTRETEERIDASRRTLINL